MNISGICLFILVCAVVPISGVSAQNVDKSAGYSVTPAGNLLMPVVMSPMTGGTITQGKTDWYSVIVPSVVPFATANTGGYSATPVLNGALPGPLQDPVPISFWDLTLREMVLATTLSFCPILVYPVELFFFLKMMTVFGYRRVERTAVSYNEKRQRIYDSIVANPAANFNTLKRLTGLKPGTLKYHLLFLEMKQRIISFGSGRTLRYFENTGRYSELEKKVIRHLQNATTRKILDILTALPEVSRKDIAKIVGIAGPSITWHTNRLSRDRIITIKKNGKYIHYTLCREVVEFFKRYQGNCSGPVSG